MHTKAQIHHIEATRQAWHEHLANCWHCYFFELYAPEHFCPAGRLAYGEFTASISASHDLESLTGTEATDAPTKTV